MQEFQTLTLLANDQRFINSVQRIFEQFSLTTKLYWDVYETMQQLPNGIQTPIIIDATVATKQEIVRWTKQNDDALWLVCTNQQEDMRYYFQHGALDVISRELVRKEIYESYVQIMQAIEQRVTQQAQQSEQQRYLKTSLAYDLLYGSIKSPKEIWQRADSVGINETPTVAFVVHIDHFYKMSEHKSKHWKWEIRQVIINAISEVLNTEVMDYLIVPIDFNKMAVLLGTSLQNRKKEYELHYIELATLCKDYILQKTSYSVTIGIGQFYDDARNLQVSFQEALAAQEYKFFNGSNSVVHFASIKANQREQQLLNYDMAIIENQIKTGNVQAATMELLSLESVLFSQQDIEPRMLKLQIAEILSAVARTAIKAGANINEITNLHRQMQSAMHILENIEQLQHLFSTTIQQLLGAVLVNYNEQTLRVVQKAIQYIEDNYTRHITLDEIADYVNLSANYFSNMFKKTTGETFVEYLAKRRIASSKQLLTQLDYTVYQVAMMVGYSDSRYFSRVFKSVVGKTPTQFRNSTIGKITTEGETNHVNTIY